MRTPFTYAEETRTCLYHFSRVQARSLLFVVCMRSLSSVGNNLTPLVKKNYLAKQELPR